MNTVLKRAAAGLAGGALAFSGLAVASAAPASAATAPIDVTKIKVVASYGGSAIDYKTKTYKVGMTGKVVNAAALGQYGNAKVYVDIFRGSRKVKRNVQIGYYSTSGYQWTSTSFSAGTRWGRGQFRVRNVRVQWYNGNTTQTRYDSKFSGGRFYMKSGVSKSRAKIRYNYRGSKRVAIINLKRFTTKGKWKGYKTKVTLQRKSGGWKKIKSFKTNKKGKAKYTFYRGAKTKYRIIVKGNKTTAGTKFSFSYKI